MIVASVTGADQVVRKLDAISAQSRIVVRSVVQRLGLELQRKVAGDYLSGRALGVVTGRLRRSVNEATTDDGTAITSSVGTNVVYGRTWELGFNGFEQVRAHSRTLGKRGIVAQVRAFSRNARKGPRPFLRPALADMRPRVADELTRALAEAGRGV